MNYLIYFSEVSTFSVKYLYSIGMLRLHNKNFVFIINGLMIKGKHMADYDKKKRRTSIKATFH